MTKKRVLAISILACVFAAVSFAAGNLAETKYGVSVERLMRKPKKEIRTAEILINLVDHNGDSVPGRLVEVSVPNLTKTGQKVRMDSKGQARITAYQGYRTVLLTKNGCNQASMGFTPVKPSESITLTMPDLAK